MLEPDIEKFDALVAELFSGFIELAGREALVVSNKQDFTCHHSRDYRLVVTPKHFIFEEAKSDGPCAYRYEFDTRRFWVRGQERPIVELLKIEPKFLGMFKDVASGKAHAATQETQHAN